MGSFDLIDPDLDSDGIPEANLEKVEQRLRSVSLHRLTRPDCQSTFEPSGSPSWPLPSKNQNRGLIQRTSNFDSDTSRTLSPEPAQTHWRSSNRKRPMRRSRAPSPSQHVILNTVSEYEPTISSDRPKKQPRLDNTYPRTEISNTDNRGAIDISDSSDEDQDTHAAHYQQVLCQLRSHGEEGAAVIYDLTQEDEDESSNNGEAEDVAREGLFSIQSRFHAQDNDVEVVEMGARRPIAHAPRAADIRIPRVVPRHVDWTARPFRTLLQYKININGQQFTCAPKKCVELNDGNFMRIASIVEDRSGAVSVIGPLFIRHNDFQRSKWPRRHNEVVQMVETKQENTIEEVKKPVNMVVKIRRLILTNQSYPAISSRTHADSIRDVHIDKEVGPLFCRWKKTDLYDSKGRAFGEIIEKLSARDADPTGRTNDMLVKDKWCKNRKSTTGERRSSNPQNPRTQSNPISQGQYSFGDTFCGGGGASCGAHEAGFFIKFGIDLNKDAMKTYAMNFERRGTKCLEQDIHEFIAWSAPGEYIVDVLHMSPPCQPFSPAHTVPNLLRDEANQAALFAVGELLKKLKPRVATLEQTFGLRGRHTDYFNALIKMFLDVGYSVHWRVMGLEGYGLPQTRKRLIIIAAGPGEILPHFPDFTHSSTDRSLKPLCTIGDKINSIPTGTKITHHDIEAAKFHTGNYKPPYSPDQLAKTITTSGGIGNYHPSGKRNFTMRELATLQMFPLSYKFADIGVTALRRQIGNAVPPYVFKKIDREIIKSLRKTDSLLR